MDNDKREENYQATGRAKLTAKQQQRLRHKENSRKTHDHAPDVFVDEKHKYVRVDCCEICRTPATASAV